MLNVSPPTGVHAWRFDAYFIEARACQTGMGADPEIRLSLRANCEARMSLRN